MCSSWLPFGSLCASLIVAIGSKRYWVTCEDQNPIPYTPYRITYPWFSMPVHKLIINVTTFPYSELLWHLFYSSLRPDRSRLILYDILTALSVSSTADFLLIDYFSHDYSSWLISYGILSQIDFVCAPDPLVYKLLVQTVFFSFDLG